MLSACCISSDVAIAGIILCALLLAHIFAIASLTLFILSLDCGYGLVNEKNCSSRHSKQHKNASRYDDKHKH